MSRVFQFPEIRRTDPDKKPTFARIGELGEIYGEYEQQQAAEDILLYPDA